MHHGDDEPGLVTVDAFRTPIEAELARQHLTRHGLRAFVGDDHIVAVHPLLDVAVGGVKVMVERRYRERAVALLQARAAAARSPTTTGGCLCCGAPLAEEADGCAACGWTWREDAAG